MIIDLAPDGDIVLVVGPEQARIRVHSLLLKLVSRPFAVMLGPNFKEGQELLASSKRGPIEIKLPDDDPASMEILCKVIHHQSHLLNTPLSPGRLIEVATSADKYDVQNVVRFQYKAWLAQHGTTQDIGTLIRFMACAYVSDDPVAFAKYTKDLMYYYVGSFIGWRDAVVQHVFPLHLFRELPYFHSFYMILKIS